MLNISPINLSTKFCLAAILEVYPEKMPDVEVLNRLFSAGLDLLYLRPSSITEIAWKQLLDNINPKYWEQIIIPVAAKKTLQDPKLIGHWKEDERKRFHPEMMLLNNDYSTSVHYLPDIINLPPTFRYVFYSPIFKSISKPGYKPQQDLETVKQTLKKLQQAKAEQLVIIGLGGIKADNIKLVKELGFGGAALMGALWQTSDPVQAFLEIKAAVDN